MTGNRKRWLTIVDNSRRKWTIVDNVNLTLLDASWQVVSNGIGTYEFSIETCRPLEL